jgi:hypothetical protein
MPVAVRERAERERGEERPVRAATPSVETPLARPRLLAPATLLRLQAAIGNAAVTGLLDSAQTEKPLEAAAAVADGSGPGAAAATVSAAAAQDGSVAAAKEAETPSGAAAPAEDGKGQAPEQPAAGAPASEKTPDAPSGSAAPAPGAESGVKPAAAKEAAAPEAGTKEGPPAGAASGRAPAAPVAEAGGEPAPGGEARPVGQEMPGAAPAAPADAGARPANPAEHPGFQQAVAQVGHAAAASSAHAPARAKAGEAQAAAVGPANERASQAKSAQVETMGEAKPKGFDKAAFVRAVQDAVAKAAPQNLEEADDFKSSGKAGKVKDEVGGLVGQGKDASRQDIKQATEAPPDASKAKPKEVTPMSEERAGPAPPPVAAAAAMPPAASPAEVNLDQGPAEVNAQMAQANVTEEQLAESNEPQFAEALQSKKQAEVHSAEAPQAYRAQEKDVLAASKGEAETAAKGGLAQMHGKRGAAMGALTAAKGATKTEDETRRAKVATDIEAIYEKTKTEVQQLLDGLDKKVDATFEADEKAAREAFENYVEKRMNAYKSERYDGVTGGLRWAKDKLFGMPDEVNVFYTEGRNAYLKQMNVVISKIADIVGNDLNAATMRIAQGRAEVAKYVAGLPTDLKKVGAEAQDKIQSKFDELDSDVESKQNELVDTLAQKYAEAQKALDDRINELKEANKGLVNKAIDAVKGAIETILKLKDMLLSVLARAVEAIADIIAHPIRFLENLIGAIKAGLSKFLANIWTHLENALLDWLFGAVAAAGLQMPAKLDFKGILDLVLQILGLPYNAIRSRVAKLVGEPVVARLEQTADVFKALVTEGPVALWKWIQDALSNLADLVLGPIKEFVVERVIKAGITWLIGILNPAAAFIKAAKAIYDIVMFFVERGREIMEFVNSILDSVVSIAKGGVGGVADIIERTLAKILPLAISFLASLLGLGGIGEKVKQIIDTVRKPITKAVDKVVLGAVNWFKKTFGGAARWVKGKVAAGKAWVKGKVEAGKKWVKGKATAAKQWGQAKTKAVTDKLAGGAVPAKEASPAAASSDEIRGQAAAALKGRIGDDVEDPGMVEGAMQGVYQQFGPTGLKSIEIVDAPDEPGVFDVYMAASAKKRVSRFRAGDFLLSGRYTPTVLIAWLNTRDLGRFESTGKEAHAERRLLKDLRSAWATLQKPPPGQGARDLRRLTLHIDITRSPCNACEGELREFAAERASRENGYYDLTLNIRTVGLYKGGDEFSISALSALRSAGAKIGVLSLRKIMIEKLIERGASPEEAEEIAGKNKKVEQLVATFKEREAKMKKKVGTPG